MPNLIEIMPWVDRWRFRDPVGFQKVEVRMISTDRLIAAREELQFQSQTAINDPRRPTGHHGECH